MNKNLTKKSHRPHETWCTQFALQFCGEVRVNRVYKQQLVVDAMLYIDEPGFHWGPMIEDVARRDVLIEHFSNSVSVAEYANCQEKIAYALKLYASVPIKDRGELRSPCMVILSYQRPDRLLREPGLFEPTNTPGIYVRKPLEMGPIYLIVTTRLPPGPEFDWLRISTRVPESPDEIRTVQSLLRDKRIAKTKREELEETMIDLIIEGKTPKEYLAELASYRETVTALEAALVEERLAAEQERLAAEQERLAAEQERLAAEQERLARKVAEERYVAALAEFQRQLDDLKRGQ